MARKARLTDSGLTDQVSRFIDLYLIDFHGTNAAIEAGFSKKTAAQIACNMLRREDVKAELKKRSAKIVEKIAVRAEDVVKELSLIAFSNIKDHASWTPDNVTLKNSVELTKEQAACIESVKQTKDGVQIKLFNKMDALNSLGKYLGIFVEKTENKVSFEGGDENGKPVLHITLNHGDVTIPTPEVAAEEAPATE